MTQERLIRRYSAYFEGWAQAFGNHRGTLDEQRPLNWLFGEGTDQIGLILTPSLLMEPFAEVLDTHTPPLSLSLGPEHIGLGEARLPMDSLDQEAARLIRWLLEAPSDLHLYQTYHLFYPQGTRILTFSRRAPLTIIYKEMDPIQVRVV